MNSFWKVVLVIIGIILLLPGLCSIVFLFGFMTGGNTLESLQLWAFFGVPGLLVSAGGVFLIRYARRA